MPIGVITGVFAILAVTTLASGLYLLLNARRVARDVSHVDNDMVGGPKYDRKHPPVARVRLVGAIFLLAMIGLGAFVFLYFARVMGPDVVRSSPASVQRP